MATTAMDDDSDEIGSEAQSCVSNESDFIEGDDCDYLALEVINYLPSDKAEMLMKSLRSKERAIEDLLRRNHSLLDTCDKLDQENQGATERCEELARRVEAAELEARVAKETKAGAAPAPAQTPAPEPAPAPAPGPKVDTSYFDRQQQGKEEKILRLSAENERLVVLSRRCQEQVAQLDARLQEVTKEAKQLRRKLQEGGGEPTRERAPLRNTGGEVDEEERLFQEMQQNEQADLIVRKMRAQMVEQRRKLAFTLEQVLSRDVLAPVSAWDSEVSALALQMESVEKCLGGVSKGLKADAAGPSGGGGGKKKGGGPKKGEDNRLDSGWVDETSSQLLDHFEAMRANLDTVDKAKHILEDAAQRFSDGSPELMATLCFEDTLQGAETEAEWIREHNAAWVEKATKLGLGEVVALVERVESAVRGLFATAPPGLLPPGVEQTLYGNLQQLAAMKAQVAEQAGSIQDLQEESISVGRRMRALQSELKTHKALLRERVSSELKAQLQPVAEAERHLGDALRRQRGLEDKARKEASDFLEEFSSAVKRAGAAMSSAAASGGADSGSTAAAKESFTEAQKGAKEVRAALATLHHGLDKGHRDMGEKLACVLDALIGAEPEHSNSQAAAPGRAPARGPERQTSKDNDGLMRDTESKSAKRRAKKKGKAGDREEAPPQKFSAPAQQTPLPSTAAAAQPPVRAPPSATGANAAPSPASNNAVSAAHQEEPVDEDAALRAEVAREFADLSPAASPAAGRASQNEAERAPSGKDLLKELKSLKSASDELEERIAQRMAKKTSSDAPKETSQKANLRKKKCLYA